jgi:multiple RNA-binding domain-containing protein 1
MVVVDYFEPSEARTAFKSLAYRRYKNSPLFLEWAPTGIMKEEYEEKKKNKDKQPPAASNSAPAPPSSSQAKPETQQPAQGTTITPEDDNYSDYSTLFIKNLNFSTTESALKEFLQRNLRVEGIRGVIIQKRQKGSQVLSQGYGFIELKNSSFAQLALPKIQGMVLDDHKLEVKPSDKRITTQPSSKQQQIAAGGARQTKIIVRNVAFQASKEEIRSLFLSFGSVKNVRIPKKMDGSHRGFAFVEFSTTQEALNAMNALKNTHLYGRHLVLEWAKAEEDDEENNNNNDNNEEGGEREEQGTGGNQRKATQLLEGKSSKAVNELRKRAREDQMKLQLSQQKRRKKSNQSDGMDDGDEEVNDLL